MPKVCQATRAEVERAARMYQTNKDARRALGIGKDTFRELCRRYGLETPGERERRNRAEWSKYKGSGRIYAKLYGKDGTERFMR